MLVSTPQRFAFLRIALLGLSMIAMSAKPCLAQKTEKEKQESSFSSTDIEMPWGEGGKPFTTPLIEMEYQLISVPNSLAGKILGLSQKSEIRAAVLDLLQRHEAKLFDISKTVTPSGNHAVSISRTKVEMEPLLSTDRKTLDLNVSLECKPSKVTLSVSIPAGRTLCLGSFENPEPDSNATIFIFAQWKFPQL